MSALSLAIRLEYHYAQFANAAEEIGARPISRGAWLSAMWDILTRG